MSMISMSHKTPVLFVNYRQEQCGVYQYGKNIFEAISKSQKYHFHWVEALSLEEIDSYVAKLDCAAIIYNYHPHTLRFIDPTLIENNPAVFKTGRLILPYTNVKKVPDTVTFGTFGFSLGTKGYQRLTDKVQSEFDEAIIRIHIPSHPKLDPSGSIARGQIEKCQRRIRKPGIRIEASHEFLDRDAMLDFLAGNTINALLYDYLRVAGVSSSPDLAMAVRRPMVITRSIMFRHLRSLYPPITIENSSLREIIRNGVEPFAHLYDLWNMDNLLAEYENILDKVLDKRYSSEFNAKKSLNQTRIHKIRRFDHEKLKRRYNGRQGIKKRRVLGLLLSKSKQTVPMTMDTSTWQASGIKRLNRVLDNQARQQYEPVISRLRLLAPEITASKVPAADVQQAFILDAVIKFGGPLASPRILCVGSYDDSACASLKKLGYPIEEIDPAVNGLDLDAFFQLPSTVKESYDIVFSTSVIEHVQDDELFVRQIADLLAPGGVGLLTCDYNNLYKPGDPLIPGDYRFYTQKDLITRILPAIKDCSLLDVPHWECTRPDFMFLGYQYTFATLAFRKTNSGPRHDR